MWQVCSLFLILIGVIEKFATALTLIPDPVVGAMVRRILSIDKSEMRHKLVMKSKKGII